MTTVVVDKHTGTVSLPDGTELPTKSAQVTLDESWSPYAQASIVCALPAQAVLDQLDPRSNARVVVRLRQDWGRPWSGKDWTQRHAGATGAQLTARYGGMAGRTITAMFFVAWNAFGVRPTSIRELNLAVREREVDHEAKEVRLELASDEGLLQDFALVDAGRWSNPTDTGIRALTAYVLTMIGATLEAGTTDAPIAAGSTEWLPGVSGWDYLRPLIEKANLRLWCDENRRWQLTDRTPLAPGNLVLSPGPVGSLVEASDTISRDSEYATAVVVEYQWTDTVTNQAKKQWDIAGTDFSKVMTVVREQPWPGSGAAASLLKRAQGRGRVLALSAVSDYQVTPGQAAAATLPSTPVQTGIVSSVAWRIPEAEMSVGTRGLIDTPATAWVFDPAGVRWVDIPVGIDWTEDI